MQANVSLQIGGDEKRAIDLISKAFNEALFEVTGKEIRSQKYDELIGFGISTWLHAFAAFGAVLAILVLIVVNKGPVAHALRALASLISRRPGITFCVTLALYLCCSFAVFYKLQDISAALGTFGFLTIGFGLILGILTSLGCYARRVQLPLTFALIVWPIIVSIVGLNDNDEISDWNSSTGAPISHATMIFANQMTERLNTFASTNERTNLTGSVKPMPLYIVAAPGGGLYASYFVSTVLVHATEEVPEFRRHFLAISSVSGGSLGAALYSALYSDNMSCGGYETTGSEREQSTEISRVSFLRHFHTNDFLAPLTAHCFFLMPFSYIFPIRSQL